MNYGLAEAQSCCPNEPHSRTLTGLAGLSLACARRNPLGRHGSLKVS